MDVDAPAPLPYMAVRIVAVSVVNRQRPIRMLLLLGLLSLFYCFKYCYISVSICHPIL